ncbi:Bcr/CflA family efflux MFS transporter [Pseudorhodoferax sp.]|uniref:Bcr/CflA family efflux MFS transporter n=1 Tax=Pseudorhodoferax sp. TaxID=1993553 RepID=UPI002DD6A1E8|nr:Bcr/CflA family efflux MFS transporter [Pseudorhodoferax sp.]
MHERQPDPKARPPLPLLVLVCLSGTMALHMVLPVLPAAAQGMDVEPAQMQRAIAVYAIGLALGQLVWGALSDGWGRRPMLLLGLALYVAAGSVAAAAQRLDVLLAARFVQAVGGSAGLALGRAMVRDTASGPDAVGQLARLNLAVVLGPALAPMVGGALAAGLGWRSVLVALAAVGALTLVLAWWRVQETSVPTGRVQLRALLADAAVLLRTRRFAAYALGGGVITTALWGFLTAAPFILVRQLGQPLHAVGLYAGVIVLGAGAGNAVTTWLARRVAGDRLMFAGVLLSTLAGGALLALVLAQALGTLQLLLALLVFTFGTGITNPVVMARALGVLPQLTGSAAGLFGCLQMAIGAGMTVLASLGSDPAVTAGLLLLGAGLLSGLCLLVAVAPARRAA